MKDQQNKLRKWMDLKYPYKAMERPRCRYYINEREKEGISIQDIAEGHFNIGKTHIFCSEGMKIQARKMMRQRKISESLQITTKNKMKQHINKHRITIKCRSLPKI